MFAALLTPNDLRVVRVGAAMLLEGLCMHKLQKRLVARVAPVALGFLALASAARAGETVATEDAVASSAASVRRWSTRWW